MPKKENVYATHKDLEFEVSSDSGPGWSNFKKFEDACATAVHLSIIHGHKYNIDVLAWSKGAARAWSGEAGVEEYNEDPEASVFDRIIVSADDVGRVA